MNTKWLRILAISILMIILSSERPATVQAEGNTTIYIPGILNQTPASSPPRILFASDRTGDWEIYEMDMFGSDLTNLTNSPSTQDFAPVMSPDGKKIAYHVGDALDSQIYVMHPDGSQKTNITQRPGTYNCCAAWSPDSSQLTFTSTRDGNWEIYKMNADGSGQTNLTQNTSFDRLSSWSPDGMQIGFYSDRDGSEQIFVMDADGSDQYRLTNNPAMNVGAAWSPNGLKIAFYSNRADQFTHIFIMDAAGSDADAVQLTYASGNDSLPHWSPDGSLLVFNREMQSKTQIAWINVDGSHENILSSNSNDITASFEPMGQVGPGVDLKINGSDGPVNLTPQDIFSVSWNSTNASSCTGSGAMAGRSGLSGIYQDGPKPVGSYSYMISCSGASGSAQDSVIVNVEALQANRMDAGGGSTCALAAGGALKCWGLNSFGNLGDGTTINRSTPTDVVGLATGVQAIAVGFQHTCVLTSTGGVKCWGNNEVGQLGDGTLTSRYTPGDVPDLTSGVIAISAGYGHTCVIVEGGGVKCWGFNGYGNLGDGTTINRSAPVDVVGLSSGVISIDMGTGHSCALLSNGSVKCWGDNQVGELGDGTTTMQATPVDVLGLGGAIQEISLGYLHTCAVSAAGGAKCWGYNLSGQLGDGSTTNRLTPVDVSGLSSGVSSIAAGSGHTCALTNSGVKCWGINTDGQVGIGTTSPVLILTPVNVIGLSSGVTAITAGVSHTCAWMVAGGMMCWGDNEVGQIGDGTTVVKPSPTNVVGFP